MPLYVGIDSGTQSTRVQVIDLAQQQVVGIGCAPHAMIDGLPPGHLEQHPQGWIEALDLALCAALAGLDRRQVRGIGVSAQQHGLVALDRDGEVIRPAKLWCDTSTVAECEALTRALGGADAVLARTGMPFLPGYTAPKIAWLKAHEPRHYRRLRHVLLPHDYLNFHLTGAYFMEYGDASGTALMDVRERTWSPAVLEAIDADLGDWLPPLSASHRSPGMLRPALVHRYGLRPDVVVAAGGGDNMMGAIGTGNLEPGVVTASLGTSGTVYAYSDAPLVDARGEIAAFCDSTGGWLPLACTMNVTGVTERFRALFGWDHAAFDAAVATVAPGADGLRLTPHLIGERTPNLPDASGTLEGLRPHTLTAAHLARAAVEGVVRGMNYGLQRLIALGVRPREIRLTGGAAASPVWRQIIADEFGVPVVKMLGDEHAALGAALQAAWCVDRSAGRTTPIATLAAAFVQCDDASRAWPGGAPAC